MDSSDKQLIQKVQEITEESGKIATKRKLTLKEKMELNFAILHNDTGRAKDLLNLMDDVNERINDLGHSPLTCSCFYEKAELVKYLIELGAAVNGADGNDESSLMVAVHKRNMQITQLLINAGANISFENKYKGSALSYSSSYSIFEIFEFLLSSGVDLNKCGGTALICASMNENIKIVKRLIEFGVDVNYSDNSWTSLHHACEKNNLVLVELLLNNGADENIENNDGKTPIEVAKNEKIKEFIRSYKPTKFVLK